jgi:HEAT repeat protein
MARWNALYDGAGTLEERQEVIRQIIGAAPSGAEELYVRALNQLVREYPNFRAGIDLNMADRIAVLLSRALGEAGTGEAADGLWDVVQNFRNTQDTAIVRAEAIIALGKIKAQAYLPQIIQILNELNSRVPDDRNTQIQNERVAYGAILALESYGDVSGYLPVFFASTGWYNNRIKNQASISLPNIAGDPTEPLTSVITGSAYGYEVKHLALRTEERSQAPDSSKAQTALAALTEGWKASTADVHLQLELSKMRKLAISMIRRYGINDEAVYPQLDNSYRRGLDQQERIDTIRTLGALGTENAAALLIAYLTDLHERRQSGALTRADESLVREVIPALGQTKQAAAREILRRIQASAWPDAIKRLAQEAGQNIP